MSVGVNGLGQFFTASVFLGFNSTPSLEMICLKNSTYQPKLTLDIFGKELMFVEGFEYYLHMTHMITLILRIYQYIINEHNNK